MMERKMYKTKLCMLYQRGNCTRQTCSFAHGDAELKRFSGSFNDRRERKGNDLRDKLDRRNSPQRRYSPGRDPRGRNAFHGQNQLRYERGYSPLRSPGKRSSIYNERTHRKKQHLDGQSDASGSLKISDGAEGVKVGPHGANLLEEQLKQVQLDIEMLDDHKSQLEMYMEERIQEAEILASRNEELEAQLRKEQEECKRITSKLTKFLKAHSRFSRAQEELKRSQARLQKLGDQFFSDASRPSANEEESSGNIVSDGEPNHDNARSPINELQKNHASSSKKRPRTSLGAREEAKLANSKKSLVGTVRSEKLTRWDGTATQPENNCNEADTENKIILGSNGHRSLAKENNKRRKNGPPSIASIEKAKGLEAGYMLPSTSMAAHAVDEFVEAVEMEEKTEVVGAPNTIGKGAPEEKERFTYLPPPPPLPPGHNVYTQFVCEDEDVEELDCKTRDADVSSEVDIERL